MPTARVYAGAAFGFVSSSDADYDAAKDGAGTLALDTTHDLRVGQSKPSGFLVEQGFLSVTPPVPLAVSARVTAATLYVYIETDASTTDFTVNARELSYGTLQMNDFVASTDLAGDTLLASKSTAGIAAGYLALTSEVALITRLPWLDGIYLSSSRQGTEPAGNEYVVIGKPGGAHPPYLLLTYEDDSINPFFGGDLHIHVGATPTEYNATAGGLYFGSTMPGGYGSAGFVVPTTDPFTPLTELVQDARVQVVYKPATDNLTLYDGYVATNPATGFAGETATFPVECGGTYYKSSFRQDFARTFVDSSLDSWWEHPDNNKNITTDSDGRLMIRAESDTTYGAYAAAAWVYRLDRGMSDDSLSYIDFTFNVQLEGSWKAKLVVSDCYATLISGKSGGTVANDFETGAVAHNHVWTITASDGPHAITRVCQAAGLVTPQFLYLYLINDVNAADNPGSDVFVKLNDIAVHGGGVHAITGLSIANPTHVTSTGHGLTNGIQVYFNGTDSTPALDPDTAYAVTRLDDDHFTVAVNVTGAGTTGSWSRIQSWTTDAIMADIATDTGLALTTDTDAIGAALAHAVVEPFATRSDALDNLALAAGEAVDYAFWGTVFAGGPRAAVVDIPAACRYLVDAHEPGVEYDVTSSAEGMPSAVRVVYPVNGDASYPDGMLRQVIRPADPGDADTRVALLDLSDAGPTTDPAAAGDAFLENMAATLYSGTITYRLPYIRKYGGGWKLAADVKAGDYVGCVQVAAHDAVPMQIVAADYTIDDQTLVMTVGSIFSLKARSGGNLPKPLVVVQTPFTSKPPKTR